MGLRPGEQRQRSMPPTAKSVHRAMTVPTKLKASYVDRLFSIERLNDPCYDVHSAVSWLTDLVP